jgi:NADH-ubiquinone oxidoreductase chain 5
MPLIILAIFSIFFGYISKDLFIGIGTGFYSDNAIFIHPLHEKLIDTEFAVPIIFKLLPFICTVTLSILYLIYSEININNIIKFKYSKLGYNVFSLLNQRFFIELFYNKYISSKLLE